jgi:hypothetical protein
MPGTTGAAMPGATGISALESPDSLVGRDTSHSSTNVLTGHAPSAPRNRSRSPALEAHRNSDSNSLNSRGLNDISLYHGNQIQPTNQSRRRNSSRASSVSSSTANKRSKKTTFQQKKKIRVFNPDDDEVINLTGNVYSNNNN